MNIVKVKNFGGVSFSSLHNGTVFVTEFGHSVFMKINKIEDCDSFVFNAVDLSNGEGTLFFDGDLVEVVDATLKIH